MDPAVLRTWIGRTELHIDELTRPRQGSCNRTLDRPATLLVGDNLPPLWHWINFLSSARIAISVWTVIRPLAVFFHQSTCQGACWPVAGWSSFHR